MTGLDLNEIALFVQVVRAGSFAEAARRLGMPANTVSRRIQGLEAHLGTRLMQRSTRKLVLTEAGRTLHERSVAQVQALQDAAAELVGDSEAPAGTVRVAAPADFMDWFLPDWVYQFLAAHPKVRIEFILSDATADLIAEGIDVAFRGGKLQDSSLVARRLANSRSVLVASPAYLEQRVMPAAPPELLQHDCLTAPSPAGRATWRLDRVDPAGRLEETVSLEVTGRFGANTVQALAKGAMAGFGIAFLPAVMVEPHVRAGRLTQVLPAWGLEGGGFYCIYPSRRQLPHAVSAFISFAMDKVVRLENGPARR